MSKYTGRVCVKCGGKIGSDDLATLNGEGWTHNYCPTPSLDNELRELAEDIRIELIGGEWTDIGGYRHTYEVGGQHIKAIVKLMSPLIQKAREETTQQLELKQAEVNFWKDRIELEKNKVKLLQRTREEAEIDGELRAHERYDIVPVKQLRSHMAARKNILELKKAKGEKR